MGKPNKQSVFSQIGARNYALEEREKNDYYATPPYALEMLLDIETFSPNVWECACGGGSLSEVLRKRKFNVKSTDLIDRGYEYGESGINFLTIPDDYFFDGDIITNPPYSLSVPFIEKSLKVIPEGHKVAMFLKLQFLESKLRYKLFKATPPPKNICIS